MIIYTTAPVGLDYGDTQDEGRIGQLSGGKWVRKVIGTDRQAQLYLATEHLAATEKQWLKYLKAKRAYMGQKPTKEAAH